MSLVDKQLGQIANDVIIGYLSKGIFPSVQAVVASVFGSLNGRIAGTPTTTYTNIEKLSNSSPTVLNSISKNVGTDIDVLYAENIDLVNRIVRDFDYKETRRQRLAQRIVEVTQDLVAAESNTSLVKFGNFSCLTEVDYRRTDAFVNLLDYTIELPPATNSSSKIDLSTALFNYTTSGTQSALLNSINNIATDFSNEAFFVQVASQSTSASVSITITLPTPQIMSKMVLTCHTNSSMVASAIINGIVLNGQVIDITKRAVWEFSPASISTIVITLQKNQPDSQASGTNNNNLFNFGIKNLSCYTEEYVPNATLYTNQKLFSEAIGTIKLDADQYIPPNCSIDWNISYDGVIFQPIQLSSVIQMAQRQTLDSKRSYPVRSVNAIAKVFNTNSSGAEIGGTDLGLASRSSIRGSRTPLFQLCRVTPGFDTINVQRGRNAWRVVTYHYDITAGGLIQNPPPTINDILTPRLNTGGTPPTIYSRYQPIEYDINNQFPGLSGQLSSALRLPAIEYPINSQNDRVMTMFEATILVDSTLAPATLATIASTTLTLPIIFSNGGATIYCNNNALPVSTIGTTLQYSTVVPLQPGTNLIQIVTNSYSSLGGASFDIGTTIFGNYLASGWITWKADSGPMSQVDLFTLQYQTSRNDFSRYTIVDDPDSSGQVVLVRELPTTVYDIATQGFAQGETTVALKAVLSGSSAQPSVTPKISSYTITVTS